MGKMDYSIEFPTLLRVDSAHTDLEPFKQDIIQDVWKDKYCRNDDSIFHTFKRVADGVFAEDVEQYGDRAKLYRDVALDAMEQGLWMPGGRILAGAGTGNKVTLMNCYVSGTIEDDMAGIFESLKEAALTQQQGGGIGMDFSTLRPEGAILKKTGSIASGPMPFMDTWNAMCATIMSAGSRRGAMMATMRCDHPDILKFIKAKHEKGRLTNFNVSVLITDKFMKAVENDLPWPLYFPVPPAVPDSRFSVHDRVKPQGGTDYCYDMIMAREMWQIITENTYEYSEPGVIFIDRINDLNNLQYCETISCTNPCGEQPLPPYGTCNLGAINLARCVKDPFTDKAEIDYDLIRDVTKLGVRFLDNVIDVTNYPLEEQEAEEFSKRRLGLGISGLADMMAQKGYRYGSDKSMGLVEAIMSVISDAAYRASADLAQEKGSFPLYNGQEFFVGTYASVRLATATRDYIKKRGIRNGVLLTMAPTGTTSVFYGNISSGIEPVFSHVHNRNVLQPDGTLKKYENVHGYGSRLWHHLNGDSAPLPDHMVTMADLIPQEHINIQAAIQKYVDASVSKTINVPEETTLEELQNVYMQAYKSGCKGCTTYRPSEVRGSILEEVKDTDTPDAIKAVFEVDTDLKDVEIPPGEYKAKITHVLNLQSNREFGSPRTRDECMSGYTYKLKWPTWDSAIYLTINHDEDGVPFEVFLQSKDSRHQEWMTALTLMISAVLRRGGSYEFLAKELQAVQSTQEGFMVNKKFYGSVVSFIGKKIQDHFEKLKDAPQSFYSKEELDEAGNWVYDDEEGGYIKVDPNEVYDPNKPLEVNTEEFLGERCPKCSAPALVHAEGCATCSSCGYSSCG